MKSKIPFTFMLCVVVMAIAATKSTAQSQVYGNNSSAFAGVLHQQTYGSLITET